MRMVLGPTVTLGRPTAIPGFIKRSCCARSCGARGGSGQGGDVTDWRLVPCAAARRPYNEFRREREGGQISQICHGQRSPTARQVPRKTSVRSTGDRRNVEAS